MKLKFKKMIVLFGAIFFVLASCHEKNNKIEQDFLSEAISHINDKTSYDWVVILPGLGCTGCIEEAEFFMGEYLENKEVLFVLTKIESLKILQRKINKHLKDYPNIHYDKQGKFVVPTNNSIYPCILEVKNKRIVSIEFSTPDNPFAFEKLKSFVETKGL
ncbi:hypothetical protein KO529_01510 [Arenibacter algicola]|uniref:hypothetical protein n=1 Tax=Arenibacter algicola TaxID=616991 RepID=UPI001C07BDCF|nr:hypothetical protein [Arenibacter algicola]MBU2903446.1 hypothetical protein [Arenibacter algicola]